MDKLQKAEQLRKALQMFAQTLTDDEAMEIATVYPTWEVDTTYKGDIYLTYGVNSVGDPQLYKTVKKHTSQADWTPDNVPSLYTPIGLNDDGYPIWSQPSGAHDAYGEGDIVEYNGKLYISIVEANTWQPGVYGWELYEG